MATGLFNLKQVNQAISQGAWSGYIAPRWVEYLVVAGGGGAAGTGSTNGIGGAGGAGGLLTGIVTVAAGTSYSVTVGGGGAGGTSTTVGTIGENSVFGNITATGGGGGAINVKGGAGGSGGGGGLLPYGGSGGDAVSGQGNAGGAGSVTGYQGGGGGGAGTVGLNGISNVSSGNGGAGIASAITGTVVTYAGGGGGGSNDTNVGGTGGVGGGGSRPSAQGAGGSGSGNTGGGGAGGFATTTNQAGGSGGSGIVVVRYPGSVQFFTGGTVTYSNGYIVHNFTANGTLAPTTPTVVSEYQISRSLRFNQADSAYLNRTPASATNQKTWTWSAWVKRGTISSLQTLFGTWSANTDAAAFGIYFGSGDTLGVLPWTNSIFTSTAVFRDPSAWYHIVVAFDSTQTIESNRIIVYVNGVSQAGTRPLAVTQGANYAINSAQSHRLGDFPASGFNTFGGYMTEVNFIDGQALTPTSFGYVNPTTGIWSPAKYVGAYGTNGFYLNFSDNSNITAATLGADYSGNGNNWTPNNFSVTAGVGNDSLVDSPTSYGTDTGVGGTVRGNYCTWNPLWLSGTFVNGNLDATTATGDSAVGTTFGMSSGKWYAEFTITRTLPTTSGAAYILVGLMSSAMPASTPLGESSLSYSYISQTGNKRNGATITAYGSTYDVNDVIGVAFDADAGSLTFYKNGTSQGTAFSSIPAATYFFGIGDGSSTLTASATLNAGQRPFIHTAPSGFKALCTQNLPTPTIGATTATQANKYFGITLRNGGGASGGTYSTTIDMASGALMWDKPRSLASSDHYLIDSVRGISKTLSSNLTDAERNYPLWFTSFNNGSYTTGSDDWATNVTVVDWIWAANGAGVTNTAGSITSTVSANTTSGFSVVTYTGTGANATVGHGLGSIPKMIIVKRRSTADTWRVYQATIGNTRFLNLNETAAAGTASTVWNNTTPTSSVFSIGTESGVNASASTYVAYCFADVEGYSKIGSYDGNGSTDGAFVFTGMRPAYVMIKRTSSTGDWFVYNNKTAPSNAVNLYLVANTSGAEGTYATLDFLSNGFKLRVSDAEVNGNGSTFIYMAFAEAPQKFSLAR